MSSVLVESIWSLADLRDQVPRYFGEEPEIAEIVKDTPAELQPITQYAAVWGIADDGYRGDLLRTSPEIARRNLKWVFGNWEDDLERWLAGPEADNPNPTLAYVAFTCMTMAADEIL